ncbi:MAG: HupE/UreJ family protein [Gammaproteobacteria bacterium]
MTQVRPRPSVAGCLLTACWMVICTLTANVAAGDELRPAYLQLTEIAPDTLEVHWKVPALGGNQRLALDIRFDEKTRALTNPLDDYRGNANLRTWKVVRPEGLAGLRITVDGLAKTSTEVLARIEYQDGTSITQRLTPNAPSYTLTAKPGFAQTIQTYFVLGVEHILFGADHLMFVFVLLLLVRNTRKLIITITAFTVAHSITLILAALELVWIPVPPVEACIALSIVFVATEIIHGQQGRPGLTARRPWIVAFGFGLLHGLGFAAALGEIGLPQNAILPVLLTFNIGVEAGQLLFVLAVLLAWQGIKNLRSSFPSWMLRAPAYGIGGMASFWVFERVYSFWP